MKSRLMVSCSLALIVFAGCSTTATVQRIAPKLPDSKLVEISVLTTSKHAGEVPPDSRVVVADIAGPCALELKNALTRRLVDNAQYEVLSRDNLEQIMVESTQNWAGAFNTETAVKLGRLLGASLFIVGQVVYCGPAGGEQFQARKGEPYDIFAVLQVVDPETGKVVLSSANEGKYFADSAPLLFDKDLGAYGKEMLGEEVAASQEKRASKGGSSGPVRKLMDKALDELGEILDSTQAAKASEDSKKEEPKEEKNPVNYPAFKAAEDLANGFADKFFSRPEWEKVEMWKNSYWSYSNSVRYVKLGHCPMALSYLKQVAAPEVSRMPDRDVAEYLHNYGVVLLCANKPQEAMEKLRSAYRIGYEQSTLRMLGLAAKALEWSLSIETDKQPEVGMLVNRDTR